MADHLSDATPVSILWTGGWDSTFQLVQLLTVHKAHVSPIYLVDEERRSTGVEILTMKRIKERLFAQYPDTKRLLLPTQYFGAADVSPNAAISDAFFRLRERYRIGVQFDWLARFCDEHGLYEVQLCLERFPGGTTYTPIADLMVETRTNDHSVVHIGEQFADTDQYRVFKYFSFPLINLPKFDTIGISREQGFAEILQMTWFCHRPTRGMKPCGMCTPCLYIMREGFGWRMPLSSRIRYHVVRGIVPQSKAAAKRVLRNRRGWTGKT